VTAYAVEQPAVQVILHKWAAEKFVREAKVDRRGLVEAVQRGRWEFDVKAAEVIFGIGPAPASVKTHASAALASDGRTITGGARRQRWLGLLPRRWQSPSSW
jgi:hypothetical protein